MHRILLANLIPGLIFFGAFVLGAVVHPIAYATEREAAHCDRAYDNDMEKVDCWYRLLEDEMLEGGVERAMRSFIAIQQAYPSFERTSCHRHAHKMGDMAYYNLYVPAQSLDAVDFPIETAGCSYGFYHGFMEHLIQDHPDAVFASDTCSTLIGAYGGMMPGLATACFHATGHGFLLGNAEKLSESAWGDAHAFLPSPLKACGALRTTEEHMTDCRYGVFNVLVEWMAIDNYGFSYDYDRPFDFCFGAPLTDLWRAACLHEMARKLDKASNRDPVRLIDILQPIPDKRLRNEMFTIAMGGAIQYGIADDAEVEYDTLARCAQLDRAYLPHCMYAIVNGLYVHGVPQQAHARVLDFCTSNEVAALDEETRCFAFAVPLLYRYYRPEDATRICVAHAACAPHNDTRKLMLAAFEKE